MVDKDRTDSDNKWSSGSGEQKDAFTLTITFNENVSGFAMTADLIINRSSDGDGGIGEWERLYSDNHAECQSGRQCDRPRQSEYCDR